jgi:hypothetical protein
VHRLTTTLASVLRRRVRILSVARTWALLPVLSVRIAVAWCAALCVTRSRAARCILAMRSAVARAGCILRMRTRAILSVRGAVLCVRASAILRMGACAVLRVCTTTLLCLQARLFTRTRFRHIAMQVAGRLPGAQLVGNITPNVLLGLRRQMRISVDCREVAQALLIRRGVAQRIG